LACGGITNPDGLGDGEADDECAVVAEAPAAVGCADAVATDPALAAALAEAAASAAFFADTALMLETSRDTARATPTINVMIGVGIFMPRGTRRGPRGVQRRKQNAEISGTTKAIAAAARGRYGRNRGALGGR
jgi:hypothetical protein